MGTPLEVLVVDDDPFQRRLIRVLLDKQGHVVREAGDVDAACAAVADFVPTIALIDIELGARSGEEVVAYLRSRSATEEVVCVAVTGQSLPEDRKRLLCAGFDAYMAKPIAPATFADRVVQLATLRLRR